MAQRIESCGTGQLLIRTDDRQRIVGAKFVVDGKTGYPRLVVDHGAGSGTLRWAVEVDRFEAGVVYTQQGHPWGDPTESTYTSSLARWIQQALTTIRANLVSVLFNSYGAQLDVAAADELIRYVEQHDLTGQFAGNEPAYPVALLVAAEARAGQNARGAQQYYERAIGCASGRRELVGRILASARTTLGQDAATALYEHLQRQPHHVKDPLDHLISIGSGRPSQPRLATLTSIIAGCADVSAVWGPPADLGAVQRHWRAVTQLSLPESFADFLGSHDHLCIESCAGGTRTVLVDIYEPARWTKVVLDVYNFAGTRTRPTKMMLFADAFKLSSKTVTPMRCGFVLATPTDNELPCGWLSGGSNNKYYLDRHLSFASWMDEMIRRLRLLIDRVTRGG